MDDRIERYSRLLAASEAECELLRAIVDLACAAHIANATADDPEANDAVPRFVRLAALDSAVAAEVARRANQ